MKKFKQIMSKKLSTTFFSLSMFIILIISTAFLGILYVFVNPRSNQVTIQSYQPVTTEPVSLTLDLSSPDDNSLVFDNNMLVSGKTIPGALVLITINNDNQTINASKIGDFSLTIKLQSGVNQLIVSAFDSTGNYKSNPRTIYYSETKL